MILQMQLILKEISNVCNNINGEELQNIYKSMIRRAQFCVYLNRKNSF